LHDDLLGHNAVLDWSDHLKLSQADSAFLISGHAVAPEPGRGDSGWRNSNDFLLVRKPLKMNRRPDERLDDISRT
jgi:hypothetical protein